MYKEVLLPVIIIIIGQLNSQLWGHALKCSLNFLENQTTLSQETLQQVTV